MLKSKEQQGTKQYGTNAKETNSLDYSKNEEITRNIVIPNSQFMAKWTKDEGYAIGIENIKITRNYDTLDKALNKIGYGVKIDEEGDEILEKYGETDFETIVMIVRALLILNEQYKETEQEQDEKNN